MQNIDGNYKSIFPRISENNNIEEEKCKEIHQEKSKKKKEESHKKKKNKHKLYPYNFSNKNQIIEEDEKRKIENEISKKEKKLKKLKVEDFELENNLAKTLCISNNRADNTFITFTSLDNVLCLIYAEKNGDKYNSIITYNIIDYKKINEIKKAHIEDITNFRHYLDKQNRRDLIISISSKDNNIRLWDITNLFFLLNITNINRIGFLKSACLLNYNNQMFIVSSNFCHLENSDPIKIFDLTGNKVDEINCNDNNIFFIDIYYDLETFITYIITGNYGYVKSYDYNNKKKYHKYKENKQIDHYEHHSAIIFQNDGVIKLIETSEKGEIRIWDFHNKELLDKIKVSDKDYDNLYGLTLWNDGFLFVGCGNEIKIVDLDNNEVLNGLVGHNNKIISVKTIIHPKYGECIISQDLYDGQIKLWVNKINKYQYLIDELNKKLRELDY